MKILVADDDPVSLRLIEAVLAKWGHEVILARDGADALEKIRSDDVRMGIIDWMMPEVDGIELCRRVRAGSSNAAGYVYLIVLTSKSDKRDLLEGLEAGADDYLVKPCDPRELQVRLNVGVRMLELEDRLSERIRELETALNTIQRLEGMLPICAYCKKVRDDKNYWHQVETYVAQRTRARFSHSVCPECFETVLKPEMEKQDSDS